MFFLDVLKLLLFATCPSPRPLRPGEKSQLNLTFHTFYSNSYNSQAIRQVSRTSPDKTALKRNRSQRGQQSEASSRNDAKELQKGSLAAWKQLCFCVLKTLRKLCAPNFIHTFCSHSYNSQAVEVMDKFFDKGVGTSPDKTALKRHQSQRGQQSEASSRNDANDLQNGSLGAWKQHCAFCALKTLCKLCPPDFIHTFYSHSYNSQAIRQVSRTSPDKTALKRNGCQWGQQSEASSRNHAKELRNAKSRCLKTTLHFLCTQNLAQTLSSGFHSHFLLTLIQLSSCWRHGQILRQGSRDITRHNRSEKKSVSTGTTVRSKQSERCERTAEREVSMLENNLALFVYSKPCANFVLWTSFTLFTHTRTTLKLLKSWTSSSTRESGHHQTQPLWKEIGIKRNLDVQHSFALLPLPKESSSISRVKEAWHCGFVIRFAFGMILPEEHIWQLVLATAPADWSWGLVLATGFLGKVQSQCSPEFCSAYIQEAAQQHSRVDSMPTFCKNSDWPTVPFLSVPCRQSCWKFVTHKAKHSTLDAGAFGTNDKAVLATIGAVTIMHKHMWTVGAAAAKNKWKNQRKGYCLFCAIFCKASRISRF